MTNETTQVQVSGRWHDAEAVVNLMDDVLREELHTARQWASEQEFVDAYCAAHRARFGEDFAVN